MAIYKQGSRGDEVRLIQQALVEAGYKIAVDGIFGRGTRDAVVAYQKSRGLAADGIVGQATWSALMKKDTGLKRSRRTIKEIVVHCTATPEGRECTVAEIRVWHKQRGFTDIGYHYVIHLDGSVDEGRDVDLAGAHATDHNRYSIGVVYVGGCTNDGKLSPKDTRTQAQKDALVRLLKQLKALYPGASILSHRDCRMSNGKMPNKACPSFDATSEYKNLK